MTMTMNTRTNLVLLVGLTLGLLLCAAVCFGQTPRCAWYDYTCNSRLSPNTRLQLHSHNPNICHCNDCVSARLAAGIEYQGLYTPRRRAPMPPPMPVYTPRKYEPKTKWCPSIPAFVRQSDPCPK